MSKYCKKCWKLNQNPLLKYCMEHIGFQNPLKRWKLKQISTKKQKRLNTTWWEKEVFKKVYNERKNCIICNKYVFEPKPWSFAHILSKKDYPHLRNFTNNIAFVCWIEHHQEVDKRISWRNKKEIEEQILNWKPIIIW